MHQDDVQKRVEARLVEPQPNSVADQRGDDRDGSGHTPGPWEIDEGDGIAIAKVSHFAITAPCTADVGSGLSREENAANARLIAAAPDMRKFLAEFIEWWEEAGSAFYGPGCRDEDEGLQQIADEAKALVAKADGR